MSPDEAAAKLQLEERGLALLRRYDDEPNIAKAIGMVREGFLPRDVAALCELPYDEEDEQPETEGEVKVWECKTPRCRQKGRVATATEAAICPSCRQPMEFLMAVDDEDEISHMRRIRVPMPQGLVDPLERTDKLKAAQAGIGDDA